MHNAPYKTLLVGDDGTPEAERAVEVALGLSRALGATLILLGVIEPPSAEAQAEGYGLDHAARNERLWEKLRRRVHSRPQGSPEVRIAVASGNPSEVIADQARQNGADLVVIGRRDVSLVRHWLEGSVSEDLVRHSPVSVLVVHEETT